VPFALLRNGYYTDGYTGQYLNAGEIVGAAADGRTSAAPRQDYAAATALLEDEAGAGITQRHGRPAAT
jgi:NAD(P)H dehydrogenase (quinone)